MQLNLSSMRMGLRIGVWTAGLTMTLAVITVTSAAIGPVALDVPTVAKASLNAVGIPAGLDVGIGETPTLGRSIPIPTVDVRYAYPFSFAIPETAETIVRQVRLPRIALGGVVGFALASAGAVMQGFFRNPMADPSIIGVSSGAAVGAVATIAFPVAFPLGLQAAAFVGALVAAFVVYAIATENGRTPVATLLLAGVAVQTFLGAVISYLLLHAGESLERAVFWLMGHLHSSSWAEVEVTLPVVVVTFFGLLAYARDLNALMLGEEDAQTVGIAVERTKRILLALSSIVTAAAVAVAGVIGFVGLIVPHVMRLLVGPDHRILLPTSALAGAAFLVATDTVARSNPATLPVGIVTSALGAPFFLYLLRRREVHEL
nr:vitamin B12 ABC transporter permease BtuC [Halorhabdus sp. SVX81]